MGPIDLSGPPPSWPPSAVELWREAVECALSRSDSWHRAPRQGDADLREVLATLLGEHPDNIVVTSGVRASAAMLGRQFSLVLHERPSFSGTVRVLRNVSEDLLLRPWHDLGPAIRAHRNEHVLVWLTSPCRNPDGASLRHEELAAMRSAVGDDALLVVNEVYRWFEPEHDARPSGVVMTGSLSKLAGPGSGLGWVRGDRVDFYAQQQEARPALFWQRCWCYVLEHNGIGLFTEHTVDPSHRAMKAFARSQPSLGLSSETNAPFALIEVPTPTETEFVDRLAQRGIAVGAGEDFLCTTPNIRVCFVDVDGDMATVAAATIAEGLREAGRGDRPPK